MAAPYSAPPTRPAPVPLSNPFLPHDTFQSFSAPPTPRARQPRPGRSQNPARLRLLKPDTSPDRANRAAAAPTEEGDPHDLALSPRHITRASVVESMVTALDHFSNPTPSSPPTARQTPDLPRHPFALRHRANTFSSDPSSDGDSTLDQHFPIPSFPQPRWRSNSNSALNFSRNLEPILSLCEEEEPTSRHRIYNSQRAYAPHHQRSSSHSGSGSTSHNSSLDLDQTHTRPNDKLTANGRSHSFDLSSNTYRLPPSHAGIHVNEAYLMQDQDEPAPMPIVHAGPSRGQSPVRLLASAQPSPLFDPNPSSGNQPARSSQPQNARKTRAGTTGTGNTRARAEPRDLADNLDNLPPIPSLLAPSAPSPVPSPSRIPASASPMDLPTPPIKDRPGFFRRVFGSKSAGTTALPSPESEGAPSREPMSRSPTQDSVRASALSNRLQRHPPSPTVLPRDTTHTLTKKSSAFFRRRKRSISDHLPAPLPAPLPVSTRTARAEADERSLVAVLPPAMDSSVARPQLPSPKSHHLPEQPSTSQQASKNANAVIVSHSHGRPVTPVITAPDASRRSTSGSESRDPRWRNPDHQHGNVLEGADDVDHSSPLASNEPPVTPTNRPARIAVSPQSDDRHSPASGSVRQVPISPPQASKLKARRGSSEHSRRLAPSTDRSISAPGPLPSPSPSGSDLDPGKAALLPAPRGQRDPSDLPSLRAASAEREVDGDHEQAVKIFENRDQNLEASEATAWLGDVGPDRERVRMAYMRLFDWTKINVLSALRGLCARIALRAETQQVDRMLEAFSQRWCECNLRHGFRSSDVVHTICYSILLLNTDLHLAELGHKMTRTQFIRNTLPTIKRIALDSSTPDEAGPVTRAGTWPRPDLTASSPHHHASVPQTPTSPLEAPLPRKSSVDETSLTTMGPLRLPEKPVPRTYSGDGDRSPNDAGPLVAAPFTGNDRAWETQVEQVLKHTYNSIARERLPLFRANAATAEVSSPVPGALLNITGNLLRRSPSTLSKAPSDQSRGRGSENRLGTGRWAVKARSRPHFHAVSSHGSTRTSTDEASSAWSPSINSTWSKVSGNRTLTSMSVDSLGSDGPQDDYQKSVGFANALSQAIIREDSAGIFHGEEGGDGFKVAPLLPDETLELSGAPWAKEGSLKHKHQAGGVDKRGKGRNWDDCFAVIEKGWIRLFSFSVNAKSLRVKAKGRAKAGGVFGGGNWMDNAEEVYKCLLHHAIASALPEPGYSKARPFVWALSLPTGALHLFQVGTREIVQEFVSTANYWSARLSKEPLTGGISNTEYGWSDQVINRALISRDPSAGRSSISTNGAGRPSMQSSVRSSIDQRGGGGSRPRRAGDKVTISEWLPPQQSMMASQLMEVDQLHALQAYVENVERDLGRHNELRPAMELAFSPRNANMNKAMVNWENKSKYLLKEIVKFKTYLDSLLLAQREKERMMTKDRSVDEPETSTEGE